MKTIVLFVLGAFLIGCATTQIVKPTIQDTDIIQASFDETWKAVIATLSEMALPIEAVEKDSGLVTTKFVNFASGWGEWKKLNGVAEVPKVMFATWSQGKYTLNIFVTSLGENTTKVKVTTHIEAYEDNVTNSWHVCYSKGIIESQIFNSVRSKIQG